MYYPSLLSFDDRFPLFRLTKPVHMWPNVPPIVAGSGPGKAPQMKNTKRFPSSAKKPWCAFLFSGCFTHDRRSLLQVWYESKGQHPAHVTPLIVQFVDDPRKHGYALIKPQTRYKGKNEVLVSLCRKSRDHGRV
jgi:hypothetical protein